MHIQYKGLALPVSKQYVDALTELLAQLEVTGDSFIINFRDPNYSIETGGFHPVETLLEKEGSVWYIQYITDFCYVGMNNTAELVKELDFDFQGGLFQNLFGIFPIEQASDIYQVWESNFLHYWKGMGVFTVSIS